MKKFTVLMLALVLTVMLVACSSGPDKQPALDALDKAGTAFNETADLINENIDLVSDDLIDRCNEISDLLSQYNDLLTGDTEIPQENLDEMTAWLEDAAEWSVAAKEEIEAGLAQIG